MDSARLISLCASHNNDTPAGRVRLGLPPADGAHVRYRLNRLSSHVSLSNDSGGSGELDTAVAFPLDFLRDRAAPLRITRRPGRCAPFKHCAAHAAELAADAALRGGAEYPDTWVLFSDDDDLWHPRRAVLYRKAIHGCPRPQAAVRHLGQACLECFTQNHGRGRGVSGVQRDGHTKLEDYRGGTFEYVFYSVPLAVLHSFAVTAPSALLTHCYADCFFARFFVGGARDGVGWQRLPFTPNMMITRVSCGTISRARMRPWTTAEMVVVGRETCRLTYWRCHLWRGCRHVCSPQWARW